MTEREVAQNKVWKLSMLATFAGILCMLVAIVYLLFYSHRTSGLLFILGGGLTMAAALMRAYSTKTRFRDEIGSIVIAAIIPFIVGVPLLNGTLLAQN